MIFKKMMKKEMKAAILSGESEADLKLIIKLAHWLGIKSIVLTEEDAEDLAMVYAMEKGKTGEYVDRKKFMSMNTAYPNERV